MSPSLVLSHSEAYRCCMTQPVNVCFQWFLSTFHIYFVILSLIQTEIVKVNESKGLFCYLLYWYTSGSSQSFKKSNKGVFFRQWILLIWSSETQKPRPPVFQTGQPIRRKLAFTKGMFYKKPLVFFFRKFIFSTPTYPLDSNQSVPRDSEISNEVTLLVWNWVSRGFYF